MPSHALLELPTQFVALILKRLLPSLNDLEKENLFLRYQLLVLKRQTKQVRVTQADRSFLAVLSQSFTSWKEACFLVKPETILKWHRQWAKWTWTTHRGGRPDLDPEIKALIIRIKSENRIWGPKRIHGELMKLGVQVSETTVKNVLRRANLPTDRSPTAGNWKEFFKRHKHIWGIDFFTVHSAFMKRMFVFVIMDLSTRELVSVRVTSHPTKEWVLNVIRGEWIKQELPPQGIVHDRDPAFDNAGFRELLLSQGVKDLRCPRRSPLANAKVERVNGTLQRECTDHFLFMNERQLQKALSEYQEYYNRDRCHQALEQRTPVAMGGGMPKAQAPRLTEITSRKYLSGLHHGYRQAAA